MTEIVLESVCSAGCGRDNAEMGDVYQAKFYVQLLSVNVLISIQPWQIRSTVWLLVMPQLGKIIIKINKTKRSIDAKF